jgi:hypothetical protein
MARVPPKAMAPNSTHASGVASLRTARTTLPRTVGSMLVPTTATGVLSSFPKLSPSLKPRSGHANDVSQPRPRSSAKLRGALMPTTSKLAPTSIISERLYVASRILLIHPLHEHMGATVFIFIHHAFFGSRFHRHMGGDTHFTLLLHSTQVLYMASILTFTTFEYPDRKAQGDGH